MSENGSRKKVVILGGGVGGYISLKRLARRAAESGLGLDITLVSESPHHDFQPLYADIALNLTQPEKVRAPVKNFAKLGARVVIDRATQIDASNRRVKLEKEGELEYDYLVVSVGTRYGWDAYPGLAEAGVHNYTLEGALEMRRELAKFRGGDIVVLVPEVPHRCGMYPYEVATFLAETLRSRGVEHSVTLVSPGDKPLGPLGPDISQAWSDKMEELGVEFVGIGAKTLEEVDPEKKMVKAGSYEGRYDLLIKVPPSRLPSVLEASEGFVWKQDPRFAPTRGDTFRHPEYDDVFMTGEHSMPPAGLVTAGIPVHYASEVAADNLVADILGVGEVVDPCGMMPCVGYFGTSGFAGYCNSPYDESQGKRVLKCFTIARSPLVKFFKQAFYHAWIEAIKTL